MPPRTVFGQKKESRPRPYPPPPEGASGLPLWSLSPARRECDERRTGSCRSARQLPEGGRLQAIFQSWRQRDRRFALEKVRVRRGGSTAPAALGPPFLKQRGYTHRRTRQIGSAWTCDSPPRASGPPARPSGAARLRRRPRGVGVDQMLDRETELYATRTAPARPMPASPRRRP